MTGKRETEAPLNFVLGIRSLSFESYLTPFNKCNSQTYVAHRLAIIRGETSDGGSLDEKLRDRSIKILEHRSPQLPPMTA